MSRSASFAGRERDGEGCPRCDPLPKVEPKKGSAKNECLRGPTLSGAGTVHTNSLSPQKFHQKNLKSVAWPSTRHGLTPLVLSMAGAARVAPIVVIATSDRR